MAQKPVHMIKMHSVENCIVVVPPGQHNAWNPEKIRAICDFRTGVGADQIMVCSDNGPMVIWNRDGSRAMACGNGTRCVIGWMNPELGEKCTIQGPLGPLTGWKTNHNTVAIAQGAVKLGGFWRYQEWVESRISEIIGPKGSQISGIPVDVGNPHVVVMGRPPVEWDWLWKPTSLDFPDGVNVSFVSPYSNHPNPIDNGTFSVKTWERGVGLTQGCGSAACAIGAVLSHRQHLGVPPAKDQIHRAHGDDRSIIAGTAISPYRLMMPGGCIQVWQEDSLWVHCADYHHIAECFWQNMS